MARLAPAAALLLAIGLLSGVAAGQDGALGPAVGSRTLADKNVCPTQAALRHRRRTSEFTLIQGLVRGRSQSAVAAWDRRPTLCRRSPKRARIVHRRNLQRRRLVWPVETWSPSLDFLTSV
jgi:hypothetical protein